MADKTEADIAAEETRADIEREKSELGIPSDPEIETEETTPETPKPDEEVVPEKEDEPESKPEEVEPKPQLTPEEGKELKKFKQELQEKLETDFNAKFEALKKELGEKKPDETKVDVLEDDVKELAKALDFDEEKTRKIIEVARKGMVNLSPEDKTILDSFKTATFEAEQKEIFRTEWKGVLPSLKEQFPNATEEQIQAAEAKMDELSHNETYHDKDMDYIMFKEKDAFGKILFSPKQKTFESGRNAAPQEDAAGELETFNPNWTPAQVDAWEKKRQNIMDSSGNEPLHIITSDDRGRTVERME